ncbi:hypothetical protein MKW94_016625, partial [Papaver nudicaule]|nr:hypothetical protein [Papaver nudicaule]
LLKGRTFPGKVLLTRSSDPLDITNSSEYSPTIDKSYSEDNLGPGDLVGRSSE